MLDGKRFKLNRATLAVGKTTEGRRKAVTIPGGAVIKIVAGPNHGDGMVDVLWEDRLFAMFEIDVNVRGAEVHDKNSGA